MLVRPWPYHFLNLHFNRKVGHQSSVLDLEAKLAYTLVTVHDVCSLHFYE